MPNLAFVSPKGGAGKTTAALLLALGLAERGERVAIIDADPNRPLLHWASLPARPHRITVHAAPTSQDVSDALREARREQPGWIILDTEGSPRGVMAVAALPLDPVLTPFAASPLEVMQAIRAAEMVAQLARRSGRSTPHRCLLTRVPAVVRPRSVRLSVEQLRQANVGVLATPLIEKEAFRTLFEVGGDLTTLERHGAPGLTAARVNASAYVESILELLREIRVAAPAA